ncbi:Separin, partial [Termitomyces sp. T112]
TDDEHLFLVLDKNLQGLPWESIPVLRGRSVSRIPSVDFLHDRVLFAEWKRKTFPADNLFSSRGAFVDPRKGYYILNPSGDLDKTEARFKGWAVDMEKVGWHGISGYAPSEQQFLNALQSQDLVVYFGHGGGEQYIRSHKIRNLSVCAATMLWGCSSGALREMGDFDRVGTPFNYMLAGSPCLVANLWDVTDKDI